MDRAPQQQQFTDTDMANRRPKQVGALLFLVVMVTFFVFTGGFGPPPPPASDGRRQPQEEEEERLRQQYLRMIRREQEGEGGQNERPAGKSVGGKEKRCGFVSVHIVFCILSFSLIPIMSPIFTHARTVNEGVVAGKCMYRKEHKSMNQMWNRLARGWGFFAFAFV